MDVLKLYDEGYAIGQSDIRADCVHFRWRDEVFVVHDRALKTEKHGYFLLAKVDDVRKSSEMVKHTRSDLI